MSDDDETEYRIEYTIQRRRSVDDDFADIGFGSSGAWSDPAQCAHIVSSDDDNYSWERDGRMPDPEDVRAEVEAVVR